MSAIFNRMVVRAEESETKLIRPSDLPLYDEPTEVRYEIAPREQGALEQNIKIVRESVNMVNDQVNEVKDQINHVYETGKAHSQGGYNQLLDEDNLLARVGVITGLGTFGLIVGMVRGRFLKRLVYTGLGAGVGTAICYPEDATQVSNNIYAESRKKAMIAYNFINGVESPVVAVNGSGGAEANFISSSITRLSRALVAWILKMKDSLASSSSGTSETRVMSEGQVNKLHKIVRVDDDGSRKLVAGDPGQGKEEDKDLYTTRS